MNNKQFLTHLKSSPEKEAIAILDSMNKEAEKTQSEIPLTLAETIVLKTIIKKGYKAILEYQKALVYHLEQRGLLIKGNSEYTLSTRGKKAIAKNIIKYLKNELNEWESYL